MPTREARRGPQAQPLIGQQGLWLVNRASDWPLICKYRGSGIKQSNIVWVPGKSKRGEKHSYTKSLRIPFYKVHQYNIISIITANTGENMENSSA